MTILAFDTSSGHCAAALFDGGMVLGSFHEEMKRGQAERLFPMLETLLGDVGIGWRDLSAIGVGIGPGNFTGIRISVSAARGLSLSLDVPAIGVSIMKAAAFDTDGPRLVAMAAPRETAFLQGFGGAQPGTLVQKPVSELRDDMAAKVVIGSAATAVSEVLGIAAAPAAHSPASAIARIAAARDWTNVSRPVPLYVRPADAAPPSDRPPEIVP